MKETQALYEMRCVLATGRSRARIRREMLAAFAADWSTPATFPCGCRLWKTGATLAVEPCALDCFVLRIVDEVGIEEAKPSSVIVDPNTDEQVADEAIRRFTR